MTWTQNYTPLINIHVSALAAATPVAVLLGLLAFGHVRAHYAALAGLLAAVAVAVFGFGMPAMLVSAAAVNGAMFGLFPIGWIVLSAIFLYNVTVATGQFEVLKNAIAGLAGDRRIQVLLIAFAFGAFIEGAAGFGTPVAISAAMLVGLGFRPLSAAGLALIGNTAPVAFGALGAPLITLANITGLPLDQLSAMVGRQLPFFSLLVPFWLIWAMAGPRAMREVWPACLTAGLSFAIAQFAVSNYIGPSLVDIIAAIVSIVSLLALLKVWQPARQWRFPYEEGVDPPFASVAPDATRAAIQERPTRAAMFRSGIPWLLLSVMVFLWGLPSVRSALNYISKPSSFISGEPFLLSEGAIHSPPSFDMPYLHNAVLRVPPVVSRSEPEKAIFNFNWLSNPGTSILLAAVISGLLLGLRPGAIAYLFARTAWTVRLSLLTIALMLALGYSTKFSGLDATMGLAFASTGVLFPFFSPLLGWLGVALTGSDTSSNVLFGNLQQITANQLGLSPILTCAANSSGGVMGKMIDAQSIVVASVATGGPQRSGVSAGEILRYVFFHSVALAALVGVLVMLQAHPLRWMIPR